MVCGVWGVGDGVQGTGHGAWGLGVRDFGNGFLGPGFSVKGSGFSVQGLVPRACGPSRAFQGGLVLKARRLLYHSSLGRE